MLIYRITFADSLPNEDYPYYSEAAARLEGMGMMYYSGQTDAYDGTGEEWTSVNDLGNVCATGWIEELEKCSELLAAFRDYKRIARAYHNGLTSADIYLAARMKWQSLCERAEQDNTIDTNYGAW